MVSHMERVGPYSKELDLSYVRNSFHKSIFDKHVVYLYDYGIILQDLIENQVQRSDCHQHDLSFDGPLVRSDRRAVLF